MATANSAPRVHTFALISGIGWVIDFITFYVLVLLGTSMFTANLIGAAVAVTLVFFAGRHFIFRNSRTRLPVAIAAYVVWNVVAIFLASLAIAAIGRLLESPDIVAWVQTTLNGLGLPLEPMYLIAPVAKIAVTPITMYFNYVAMGLIIERQLRLW